MTHDELLEALIREATLPLNKLLMEAGRCPNCICEFTNYRCAKRAEYNRRRKEKLKESKDA